MLRILVAVFFWLCAIGVLALSIRAEITDARQHKSPPSQFKTHSMHR